MNTAVTQGEMCCSFVCKIKALLSAVVSILLGWLWIVSTDILNYSEKDTP